MRIELDAVALGVASEYDIRHISDTRTTFRIFFNESCSRYSTGAIIVDRSTRRTYVRHIFLPIAHT